MIGIDRETLARDLGRNIVKVTFRKKDGEIREMNCTLNETAIIAADRVPKGTKDVIKSAIMDEKVMRVLDVDLGEWRGFIFDNVEKVEHVEKIV